jgi:tetratricopeptide (TPR) repeat protein
VLAPSSPGLPDVFQDPGGLDELILRNPQYSNLLALRANHFSSHGRVEEALRDCDESIALMHANPDLHFPSHESDYPPPVSWRYESRAYLLKESGRYDQALKEYSWLYEIIPESKLAYEIALLLGVLGREEQSLEWLHQSNDRTSLAYLPYGLRRYYRDRAELFQAVGCYSEATDDYRRAFDAGSATDDEAYSLCVSIASLLDVEHNEEAPIWYRRAEAIRMPWHKPNTCWEGWGEVARAAR